MGYRMEGRLARRVRTSTTDEEGGMEDDMLMLRTEPPGLNVGSPGGVWCCWTEPQESWGCRSGVDCQREGAGRQAVTGPRDRVVRRVMVMEWSAMGKVEPGPRGKTLRWSRVTRKSQD